LTACLLATDWKQQGADLPDDLVSAGLSISGLFDLSPLMHTAMNQDLKLDAASAARVSPLFWDIAGGRTLDAWVGGAESGELFRQSAESCKSWGEKGVNTDGGVRPGTKHFTAPAPLPDPESRMTRRLVHRAMQGA